jgi:hypothetical protein
VAIDWATASHRTGLNVFADAKNDVILIGRGEPDEATEKLTVAEASWLMVAALPAMVNLLRRAKGASDE